MKRIKQTLSLVITFLMLLTLVPKFELKANAAEEVFPAADTAVTLVGDIISAAGLGDNWAPDNNNALMKEYKDGLYELTLNFQNATDIIKGQYKVALNRSWDVSYGAGGIKGGSNIDINIPANSLVIFRFNSKTHEIYDSINNPDKFKKSATLVGTFAQNGGQDWNPADSSHHLDYIGGGFFSKVFHLKAGQYEYKAAYDDIWGNGEVGSNVKLSLSNDADVTFLSNPLIGICTDSVNNPAATWDISLIGDIRGNDAWTADKRGYEFHPITENGMYAYSAFFATPGTYAYKGIENFSWDSGGVPSSGNLSITIPEGGKYVVFVADKINKKMFDSINNPVDVANALGLAAPEVTVKSPVINLNGTVTFSYKGETATSVSLRGSMNNWGETPMVKDQNTGLWSVTLRLGDTAKNYEYKFFVNNSSWITDPVNLKTSNGNSLLEFPQYEGRKVVLAGTIQSAAGETTWNPGSDKTKLLYDGNGKYHITIPNVPAGNYEYKIAMASWDPENYGANGKSYGDNMKVSVPAAQDITFWYNDDSHYTVDSINYRKLDISLTGTGIPAGTKLTDDYLRGIYSAKLTLNNGSYYDIKAVNTTDKTEHPYGAINVSEASRGITFSYDPITDMAFSDASNNPIDSAKLYFNSRDEKYKSPYGAVPADKKITFNLQTGKDIVEAKVILVTNSGTIKVPMSNSGAIDENTNKWTANYTFANVGMNKYYFVISNGSDVKAYGDDDGYYGEGKVSSLGDVIPYGLNIYDKDFKTPEWMKNAVIYQIFPDRFFNGDYSNDFAQNLARGNVYYEFTTKWNLSPEDPTIEYLKDKDGNIIKDANGNSVVDPNYSGFIGDGEWSNDMYGGDIKGVQAKLDYLQALGINVLYFNPISQSISNHRYDTTDYTNVDPLLGHMDDFVNLTKEAHKRNMHVILDGVFNHVSDDSIYFDRYDKYMASAKPIGAYQYWSRVYDLMNTKGLNQQDAEKQVAADLRAQGITDLHYKDWFKIDNVIVDQGKPTQHYQYEGWWGYDSMPVIQAINGSEYEVKSWADEIIDGPDSNSRYWLRQGSNGWRLDVANEVSDETWRHFRQAVKSEGDNVIIGEIWDDASKYLLGDMYDSVMNYRFRNAVLYFVKGTDDTGKKVTNAVDAMNQLEQMREQYPKEAFEAMMNLVDSHDTQRVISALDGYQKSVKAIAKDPSEEALAKMKLIPLIQMTYPGAPTIYYGDEAGMPGADDPDNRRGMLWGKGNKDLVEWYATLTNIRNNYSVLRTGDIVPVQVDKSYEADVMSYLRNDDSNHALVVVNRKAQDIGKLSISVPTIPNGTQLTNALNPKEKYKVSNGVVTVDVPSESGLILVGKYKSIKVNYSALRDAYDSSFIVPDRVRVTGIKIDKTSAILNTEKKLQLQALVTPDNATLKNVVWSSSNNEIAKVDANGVVTGVSSGKATITAVTIDGGYTAKADITVTIPVKAVHLNKSVLILNNAQVDSLIATVLPANADNKNVIWKTENTGIATVNSDGKVTAVHYGITRVTITTEDGNLTDSCLIIVLPKLSDLIKF